MLRETLEQEARRAGFGEVRIAEAGPPPRFERYDAFVAGERHGEMGWMADTRDLRADAHRLLPDARSVVVLSMHYGQATPPDPGGLTGRVASYAWGRDYHNLIAVRLKRVRKALEAAFPGLRTWGGVDSKPAWERAWADAAGLGYSGKNGMAILPGDTSRFFLAVLLLSEPLEPDAPLGDHCGKCQRCLDACPTNAFLPGGGMDARRCISYLTIEHRGIIPEELRSRMGRWVFGCDVCQDVCPHVGMPRRIPEEDYLPRNAFLPLPALLDADDDAILATFEGTPLRRAGPSRLRRNACVALGNIGDPAAGPVLLRARMCDDPVVVVHARWALERLGI